MDDRYAVDVMVRLEGRSYGRHFTSSLFLLRYLDRIGKERKFLGEIRENANPWRAAQTRALEAKLHAEKGLTCFRRNQPLTLNAYSWLQLKELAGVRTNHETPTSEVHSRPGCSPSRTESSRSPRTRNKRTLRKRVRKSGVPRLQPDSKAGLLFGARGPQAVPGGKPFSRRSAPPKTVQV